MSETQTTEQVDIGAPNVAVTPEQGAPATEIAPDAPESAPEPKAAGKASTAQKNGSAANGAANGAGEVMQGEVIKANKGANAMSITKPQDEKTYFDYNNITKTKRIELRKITERYRLQESRANLAIVETGRALIDAKELLEHGEFQDWVAAELGMSISLAESRMNIVRAFGHVKDFEKLPFGKSALFALAAPSVASEIRDQAVEIAQSGTPITHTKANELLGKDKKADKADKAATTPVGTIGENGAILNKVASPNATPASDPAVDQIDLPQTSDEDNQIELTAAEYAKTLPLHEQLFQHVSVYQVFVADAYATRKYLDSPVRKELRALVKELAKESSAVSPETGFALLTLADAAKLKDPKDWKLCDRCKGCGRVWQAKQEPKGYLEPGNVKADDTNQLAKRGNKVNCSSCNGGYQI